MTRTNIAILLAIALLTSACAGLPGVAETPPEIRTGDTITPTQPDWIMQRSAVAASLTDHAGIETHQMDDGSLLVRLPAAQGFSPNSQAPTRTLLGMIDRIVPLLRQYPDNDVLILGHTDSIGSEVYNLGLSIGRAEAVMEYLVTEGVSLGRLRADGRGESEPIADNGSEEGRATNRRVELILSPKQ